MRILKVIDYTLERLSHYLKKFMCIKNTSSVHDNTASKLMDEMYKLVRLAILYSLN